MAKKRTPRKRAASARPNKPARPTKRVRPTKPRPTKSARATKAISPTSPIVSPTSGGGSGLSTGPIVTGPNIPLLPDPIGNFFDTTRVGKAVVRPGDLLALRIELHNLAVEAGTPPKVRKTATGAAHIIVHFPPQTITERNVLRGKAGWHDGSRRARMANPTSRTLAAAETLTPPPINARISGESRIAFKVPDGFVADYTLQGILDAIEDLELAVPANARPPASPVTVRRHGHLCSGPQRPSPRCSAPRSRASRSEACASQPCRATRRRCCSGRRMGIQEFGRWRASVLTSVDITPGVVVAQPRPGPSPALPTARQTAIEMPWRLILSPHSAERWRHAKTPVTSPAGRTELWHSRLVAPKANGDRDRAAAPRPAAHACARSGRLTGEDSQQPMQGEFPIATMDEVPDCRARPAVPDADRRLRPLPDRPPVVELLAYRTTRRARSAPTC